MIVMKQVYEPAVESDGYRVLTERLWPRGVSKARAALDAWKKQIAPSDELRPLVQSRSRQVGRVPGPLRARVGGPGGAGDTG